MCTGTCPATAQERNVEEGIMGERKRDSGRLPAAPPRRNRVANQHAQGNSSPAGGGEPGANARMPQDVAAALDELRAAAEAHDNDLKYSFLEAS
jgi:hypothetical protein